ARRTQCKNNLKQFGLAMANYHDVNGYFPMGGTIGCCDQPPSIGYMVRVFPYIDQLPLYNQINFNAANAYLIPGSNPPANYGFITTKIPVARCPSDSHGFAADMINGWTVANYDGSAGSMTFGSPNGSCNIYFPPTFGVLMGGWGDNSDPNATSGM